MGVHVALSVTDLSRSAKFYEEVVGAQHLMDFDLGGAPARIYMVPENLIVGLRQDPSVDAADRFDYARVGLDHLGMHVADRPELEERLADLDARGIEHSGIIDDAFGMHLNFKDPDGIALEFFASAPQQG